MEAGPSKNIRTRPTAHWGKLGGRLDGRRKLSFYIDARYASSRGGVTRARRQDSIRQYAATVRTGRDMEGLEYEQGSSVRIFLAVLLGLGVLIDGS